MNILIAHDGLPASEPIVQDLQRCGLPGAANTTVLCVAEEIPIADFSGLGLPGELGGAGLMGVELEEDVTSEKATALEVSDQVAGLFPDWKISAEALVGRPGRTIVRTARSLHADLIFVGSAGKKGLKRWMLGSVSREVIAQAPCAVHISRPRRDGHGGGDGKLRILVAYDGSAGADAAVRALENRSWPAGTRVRIVAAVDHQIIKALPVALSTLSDQGLATLQQLLGDAVESLHRLGLEVTSHIAEGDPTQLLIEQANLWMADCIFIGSRGLGGAARLLMGSVSTAVAEQAPCSVEVVRNP